MPHFKKTSMDKVEIYSSKKKSVMLLIGSILFVVLGFWLFLNAENLTGWRVTNPFFTRGIGIVSILFFGLVIFIGIKRLIKSEISMIVSFEGINLNPRKSLTDFIKWNDIIGFDEIKIQSTRIIIISVKNPEYWLSKEANGIRRKLMRFNISNYHSPFNISAAGLDISYDKLIEILNNYFDKYKNAP
jgi:hypothetical protein